MIEECLAKAAYEILPGGQMHLFSADTGQQRLNRLAADNRRPRRYRGRRTPTGRAGESIERVGDRMKTSQDRILTTHVGSLPRPQAVRQLLVRKDQGEAYDKAELARLTRQAVFDIVRRQADTGIDIVNDGEMSKPGYSTYVADRLSGFAGHEPAKPRLGTPEHPNFPR